MRTKKQTAEMKKAEAMSKGLSAKAPKSKYARKFRAKTKSPNSPFKPVKGSVSTPKGVEKGNISPDPSELLKTIRTQGGRKAQRELEDHPDLHPGRDDEK